MTTQGQKPVLIIGAGPVGLSLALALVRRGIRVEVFETLPELNPMDRANTFHPATLEIFSEWDIAEDAIKAGQRVNSVQYWERESEELVAEFDFSLIAPYTDYPFRLHFPQHLYTRLILPIIEETGLGKVHFKHRLANFEETGSGVSATFRTRDGESIFNGSLICGADGARSTVRKQVDIRFQGRDYTDRFLLVNTNLHPSQIFDGMTDMAYMFDPTEWVVVMHMPHRYTRMIFRVTEDEDTEVIRAESLIRRRIDRFVPVTGYDIKGVSIYKVQQRVAETFHKNRVLLLGDAAHLNNPIGGMGMNSGIHDANALAPYIQRVLNGEDPKIFQQYTDQRREVAVRYVQRNSDADYGDMTADTEEELLDRTRRFAHTSGSLKQARNFMLRNSMLEDRIPRES